MLRQSTAIRDDQDAGDTPLPRYVEAPLSYVARGDEKPTIDLSTHGARVERNLTRMSRNVLIANGRLTPPPSLDREGFALTHHETAVRDFVDENEIRTVYYPEMEWLLREATGASSVVVFDHNLRTDGGDTANANRRPPVHQVHNDFTERSANRRAVGLVGAGTLARARRFSIVNVWRPIRGPVLMAPLALADARSVATKDLVAVDLVYPDRTGEIFYGAWNPRHRWVYYPAMASREALLIKGYDSLDDGRAHLALHTAFDDPTAPIVAPPRESIEVRAVVLFG